MKKFLLVSAVVSAFILAGCASEPVKQDLGGEVKALGTDAVKVGGDVIDAGKEVGKEVVKEAVTAAKKKASVLKDTVVKQVKETAVDVGAAAIKKGTKVVSGAAGTALEAVTSAKDTANKAIDGTGAKVTSTVKGAGTWLKNLIGE